MTKKRRQPLPTRYIFIFAAACIVAGIILYIWFINREQVTPSIAEEIVVILWSAGILALGAGTIRLTSRIGRRDG